MRNIPSDTGYGLVTDDDVGFQSATSSHEDDGKDYYGDLVSQLAPIILYVFDLKRMTNVWVNRSIFEMLGYWEESIEGRRELLADLMHPEDQDKYGHHYNRLLTLSPGDIVSFEYRMRHKQGHWVWLRSEEVAYERGRDGKVTKIIGAAQNVSEARGRHHKLLGTTATLERKLDEALALAGSAIAALHEESEAKVKTQALDREFDRIISSSHVSRFNGREGTVDLNELVAAYISPYRPYCAIKSSGVPALLQAEQVEAIGRIIEALVVQSRKAGVLNAIGGELRTKITSFDTSNGKTVVLRWEESPEGELVSNPESIPGVREAMGMILAIARELKGEANQHYSENGMYLSLQFPLE
jgi:PAS domain S-box-containing protein